MATAADQIAEWQRRVNELEEESKRLKQSAAAAAARAHLLALAKEQACERTHKARLLASKRKVAASTFGKSFQAAPFGQVAVTRPDSARYMRASTAGIMDPPAYLCGRPSSCSPMPAAIIGRAFATFYTSLAAAHEPGAVSDAAAIQSAVMLSTLCTDGFPDEKGMQKDVPPVLAELFGGTEKSPPSPDLASPVDVSPVLLPGHGSSTTDGTLLDDEGEPCAIIELKKELALAAIRTCRSCNTMRSCPK